MKKRNIKRDSKFMFFKKKCSLCKNNVKEIDYKDTKRLEKFISRRSRILPRKISGNCVKHQHRIVQAIKRARDMALLPYEEK